MVRAVRLAATLGFAVEPATLAAIGANAGLVEHLSGERIGAELEKLLAAPAPSIGLRLAEETGLLGGRRARSRSAARHPPEQGRRARTCGTTRCAPSTRRPRRARSCASRRSSTTSASRPPWPTATSTTTMSVGARPRGACCAGCGSRGRRWRTSRTSCAHHMFTVSPTLIGRGRPAVHQAHRAPPPRRPVRPPAGGRHRVSGLRRTTRPSPRSAPASTRSSRRGGARPVRPRGRRRRPDP